MFYSTTLLAIAASASCVSAVTKGYNYGATKTDGSAKTKEDFANEFSTCSKLDGTTGFTSARLYTNIVRLHHDMSFEELMLIPAAASWHTRHRFWRLSGCRGHEHRPDARHLGFRGLVCR